jgi:putative component of membrane protein insertase Oxa1/YidC/SpoIIIJ protein YidD
VGGVDYTKYVPAIQNILEKWLSSTTCKFLEKCPNTFKKSHAHLQCVHVNCARFEECQPKGVGGFDYTK